MRRSGLHVTGVLFFVFFIHSYLFSVEISSRIISVTVFTDRALVTRRVSFSAVPGTNDIVLQNLPLQLDPSSVQVKGKGRFTLRNVKVSDRYTVAAEPERMKELLKKKENLQNILAGNRDTAAEIKSERSFVESIAAMFTRSGKNLSPEAFNPEKWIKIITFYRQKLRELDKELRKTNTDIRGTEKKIKKIEREIRSLGHQQNRGVKKITLTIASPSAGKGSFDVSYLVPGPTWAADYTMQINSRGKTVSLMYRAVVYQSTGEDWKNTALVLSTAQPAAGGTLPKLRPWYLDVHKPSLFGALASAPSPMAPMVKKGGDSLLKKSIPLPRMNYSITRVQSGMTSVVFKTEGKTTIDSDNQGHSVTIALFTMPAVFTYSCIPKESSFVFLQAAVTNASSYPLLAGTAHIFLDGNFTVKTPLKYVASGEKFRINCGIDEGFSVERTLINRFKSTSGLFSKKTTITYKYLLRIVNNHDVQKKVEIQDQIPVSRDKDIVVKLLEPRYTGNSSAVMKSADGYITWTRLIGPGKAVMIPFSFSVSFPHSVHVDNLE